MEQFPVLIKHLFAAVCVAAVSAAAVASENVVFGFIIEKPALDHFVGSNDLELVGKILESNAVAIDDVTPRLKYWAEYQERGALSVQEALKHMLTGDMQEAYAFEYQCMTELILRALGEEMQDQSRDLVLWNFLDLWLDAPHSMMKNLKLSVLANKWMLADNPIAVPGTVSWPIVSHLDRSALEQAVSEAGAIDLQRIFDLKDELFEGRGDELSASELKEMNHQVLKELLRWVHAAHARNVQNDGADYYLVLVFDGDS